MKSRIFAAALLLFISSGVARSDEPDNSFLVSLERTACYGTCSTYQVTLEPNSTVTFIGKSNVTALGEHVSSVDSDVAQQLLSKIDASGLLDMPPDMEQQCKSWTTDVPGLILFYRKGDKSRKVSDVSGCGGNEKLDKVRALAREMENVLQNAQW